jgi:teichuronic acid biosynthesis glycosyltransferase TuaC
MNVLHIAGSVPVKGGPSYQPFIKSQTDSLEKAGIKVELLNLKGYESQFNYILGAGKIKEIVRENNIDLIHAHYVYCGLSALLARTGKPIVLSLMGSDLLGSTTKKGKVSLRGKADSFLSKVISKYVDKVIVKTMQMKSELPFSNKVEVIPNGVNFDVFKPMDKSNCRKELGLDSETFYAIFLADPVNNEKNYPLAEASINFFKQKYGIEKAEMLVIKNVSHTEIVKYLNACDVLLFTSFLEGSPNAIKEAMACNTPIVSTDVGDVKEIISGTKNCFIVPYDENKAAETLKEVYDNRERTNGRERIDYLNEEVISERIIKVYKELVKIN